MKKASKPVKVLCILPTMNKCGGIESFYKNYYYNFSKNIKVDFITHQNDDEELEHYIENRGDKLYCLPKFDIKNYIKIKHLASEIMQSGYDIVHCNMANAAFLYLKIARMRGCNIRILHSHQNKYAGSLSHAIRNVPLVACGQKYANAYLACSKQAGDFLFPKKTYIVINNLVDCKKFAFSQHNRNAIRKKYNVSEDELLIGNFARFSKEKNQIFGIDLVKRLKDDGIKTKMLLIGHGELKDTLSKYIKEKKLNNEVLIQSTKNDIEKYYSALDIFILPSSYEGLGMVGIEAQAASTYTLLSTGVPSDIVLSKNTERLDLDIDIWEEKVKQAIPLCRNKGIGANAKLRKFDLKEHSKDLEQLYLKMIRDAKRQSV